MVVLMDELKIPRHVAIILDGNGRWATEKGKKRTEGHKAGYKNLKKLGKYILKKELNIYLFLRFLQKTLIDQMKK